VYNCDCVYVETESSHVPVEAIQPDPDPKVSVVVERVNKLPMLSTAGKAASLDYTQDYSGTPLILGLTLLYVWEYVISKIAAYTCAFVSPITFCVQLYIYIYIDLFVCLFNAYIHTMLLPIESSGVKPSSTADILFLVFHGGSALDARKDQIGKDIDFQTISSSFKSIIGLHFPSAIGRVALRMVPCVNVCSEAIQLLCQVGVA